MVGGLIAAIVFRFASKKSSASNTNSNSTGNDSEVSSAQIPQIVNEEYTTTPVTVNSSNPVTVTPTTPITINNPAPPTPPPTQPSTPAPPVSRPSRPRSPVRDRPHRSTKSPNYITYTVRPGDNLYDIGRRYGVNWTTIYADNRAAVGSNPNLIHPGLVLRIPR